MTDPNPAAKATAAVFSIAITTCSAGLLLFGAAVGLSCERWATGRDQCTESWKLGLNAAVGGILGLAGTWVRNPYIRRKEDEDAAQQQQTPAGGATGVDPAAPARRLPPRGPDGRFRKFAETP